MAPIVRTPHTPTAPLPPSQPPPQLSIAGFPSTVASVIGLPHSQAPPAGVVALDPQFVPPGHIPGSAPIPLIRPGSPSAPLGLAPRPPLLPASPLGTPTAPPPPYPATPHSSVAEQSSEEFTCSSPSQFLRSPTFVTATTALQPAAGDATKVATNTGRSGPLKKENQPLPPPLPAAMSRSPTKSASRRDQHSVKVKVLKHRKATLAALKLKYEVQLKERFFLEEGGNMMDFLQWKRKPNILREQFLKQHNIEAEATSFDPLLSPRDSGALSSLKVGVVPAVSPKVEEEQPVLDISGPRLSSETSPLKHGHKSSKSGGGGSSRSGQSKAESSSTRIQIPLSTVSPSLQVVSPLPLSSTPPKAPLTATPTPTPSSPVKALQFPSPSPRPATRAQTQTQASFSSIYETSHEDIVMKARHEAEVVRAIADLRKEGLWSASRLPKVQEPGRKKVLWDYLLEEMQWLATDFANERRWKINAARKVGCSVTTGWWCGGGVVGDQHSHSLCDGCEYRY